MKRVKDTPPRTKPLVVTGGWLTHMLRTNRLRSGEAAQYLTLSWGEYSDVIAGRAEIAGDSEHGLVFVEVRR